MYIAKHSAKDPTIFANWFLIHELSSFYADILAAGSQDPMLVKNCPESKARNHTWPSRYLKLDGADTHRHRGKDSHTLLRARWQDTNTRQQSERQQKNKTRKARTGV
jgi:hypothetical protein